MKRVLFFGLVVSIVLFSLSCKKKKINTLDNSTNITSETATLTFSINNVIDSKPINFGVLEFVNKAGNTYSVNELKYYLSGFELTKDDGTVVTSSQVSLIDAADEIMQSFDMKQIPNGTYKKMKFFIGVSPSSNHNGLQEGALDPMHGMFWSWNTGYVFFKHDGQFIDSTGATQGISFHLGTDAAYTKIEIPVNFTVSGTAKNVFIKFDLNKLYEAPNLIDFDLGNNQQSTTATDSAWIVKMAQNFNHSFSFDHAE